MGPATNKRNEHRNQERLLAMTLPAVLFLPVIAACITPTMSTFKWNVLGTCTTSTQPAWASSERGCHCHNSSLYRALFRTVYIGLYILDIILGLYVPDPNGKTYEWRIDSECAGNEHPKALALHLSPQLTSSHQLKAAVRTQTS